MEEIQEKPPASTAVADVTPQTDNGNGALPEGAQGLETRQIVGIVLIAIVILVVVGLSIYGMATHPDLTSVLRDISIIVLALVTLVIGLFLIILIFQLQSLIVLLRDEVKPILESANQAANTVRGTTNFMSDAVVTPMITVISSLSAIRQGTSLLFGGSSRKRQRTAAPPPPAPPPPDPES